LASRIQGRRYLDLKRGSLGSRQILKSQKRKRREWW
jgi:hypothetical protein